MELRYGSAGWVAVPTPLGSTGTNRSMWLSFPGRGQEVLQVGAWLGGFGFDLVVRV